jgi:nitrous oxidase accessory protein NosD/nitrous oxide reductase accessory protein NosL
VTPVVGRSLPAVVVAVLLVSSTALIVPVGTDDVEPAPFEDTLSLGLTNEATQEVGQRGLSIPRVQVLYSGYEYVVGFNSIRAYAAEQHRTGHQRQFGRPVAVFVSDFADTNATLTSEGYLTTTWHVGFEPASETVVVVGSEARLPDAGRVAVPFSDRAAAASFADRYGGEVVPWADVTDRIDTGSPLSRDRFRGAIETRSAWADGTVAAARTLRDRPTSVVVGEDVPTLEAALDAAPPNTTVELPAGTYRSDGLTVEKPLTIAGVGSDSHITGDGNGSVISLNASRSALVDVSIDGVGDVGSRRGQLNASELDDVPWSENIELAYGHGDAAIKLVGANRSLVEGVDIATPSSGIILLDSSGATVRDTDVNVTRDSENGFMGLVAMYSPVVVEDSRFTGGRDGVYTHRADGLVVRDNVFRDGRYGVHEMYTFRSLVRNNTVRNEDIGIIVMTRPSGNLVVGNDIRQSTVGLSTAGSYSYFARNVLVDNGRGIDVLGFQSRLEHNTVVNNDIGLRAGSGLPTNLVTRNDIVGNTRTVETGLGPLRVWTAEDAGNYWGQMPGMDDDSDGHYDRPFRPTHPVDAQIHDEPGAYTLAVSPAVQSVRGVRGSVPGLRSSGIVDTAPRVSPARPDVLAAVRDDANATGDTDD